MTQADLELVASAFGGVRAGVEIDMAAFFAEESVVADLAAAMTDDADVEFVTPDGGFVGEMAGPFRGPDGLRTGWLEWTAAWESWTFRATELIDAGDGNVLLLGDSVGRFAGSGLELETQAAALYTVRDGKIVRIQHFLDQDQARRAAGLT